MEGTPFTVHALFCNIWDCGLPLALSCLRKEKKKEKYLPLRIMTGASVPRSLKLLL